MDINWSFEEVQAALVYATGIFAGAIVAAAAVFWEWHGKNSGERERLERGLSRKMRNTLCAIKAEIDTELEPLERGYGAQVAPALKAAFKKQHREGTVKPLPRAPVAAMLYEQDRLCLALEFVPPPLAKRITTFYKAMYALNAMQAMINSGAFDDINDVRQDAIAVRSAPKRSSFPCWIREWPLRGFRRSEETNVSNRGNDRTHGALHRRCNPYSKPRGPIQ